MRWLDPLTTTVGLPGAPSIQVWRTPVSVGSAAMRYGSSSSTNGPGQALRPDSAASRIRNERQSGYSTSSNPGNRRATAVAR